MNTPGPVKWQRMLYLVGGLNVGPRRRRPSDMLMTRVLTMIVLEMNIERQNLEEFESHSMVKSRAISNASTYLPRYLL